MPQLREVSMSITNYRVVGMNCGHCEKSVRKELSAVPGVDQVEVSAETGVLTIEQLAYRRRGSAGGRY
jgi:copper chaperone CopZ